MAEKKPNDRTQEKIEVPSEQREGLTDGAYKHQPIEKAGPGGKVLPQPGEPDYPSGDRRPGTPTSKKIRTI